LEAMEFRMQDARDGNYELRATRVPDKIRLDAAHPAKEWETAEAIRFSTDWQGKNADSALETEVRVLWSPAMLYLRFVCHYRDLFVFDDSDPNGRRDHLWDRDVAEAFLQPPDSMSESGRVGPVGHARAGESSPSASGRALPEMREDARYHKVEGDYDTPYASYKEFEIAPNGMWIDLDIIPSGRGDLRSGMTRSVHVDEKRKIWTAELAIPMKALTKNFDPSAAWRVNFYRVEGKVEPREYMAWQPTMSPQPNFHVPEKFGRLRFAPGMAPPPLTR
jgi:alpha-galactosidase